MYNVKTLIITTRKSLMTHYNLKNNDTIINYVHIKEVPNLIAENSTLKAQLVS